MAVTVVADPAHHEPLEAVQEAAATDTRSLHLQGEEPMCGGELVTQGRVAKRPVGTSDRAVMNLGKSSPVPGHISPRMMQPAIRIVVQQVGTFGRATIAGQLRRPPVIKPPLP